VSLYPRVMGVLGRADRRIPQMIGPNACRHAALVDERCECVLRKPCWPRYVNERRCRRCRLGRRLDGLLPVAEASVGPHPPAHTAFANTSMQQRYRSLTL
jgi:hypothetical protein